MDRYFNSKPIKRHFTKKAMQDAIHLVIKEN